MKKTKQMFQSFRFLFICILFFVPQVGFSQITVTGVSTRQIYPDSVTFTVVSESGYDTVAQLNNSPVPLDTPVLVDEPEYYELTVSKTPQSAGTAETLTIQFIVRATERANTEWGLPVFTPYPDIPSAPAEFIGSQLEIIAPAGYPPGLDIPVIARIESPSSKRTGVNGLVLAPGFEDHPLQLRRGVGSVFLPPATDPGVLTYDAQVHSLSAPKQITIEPAPAWQTISGTLAASAEWGPGARVKITADLAIPAGVTLTIHPDSVILLAPGVEITLNGTLVANGTASQPIVFTAENRTAPWGGFLCQASTSRAEFAHCIFTASGADPTWFNTHSGYFTHRPEQCLFLVTNSARVTLTDCAVVENAGQVGHGESGYLTMTRCLVQKAVTVGQYNNGSVTCTDTALIEFPPVRNGFVDADNDCIYLSGGPHAFTDCLFGWTLDDAIDAGQGDEGAVTFTGAWFESAIHEAMAFSSGPRYATVTDTVVLNCGQAIECGYDRPYVEVARTLCTGNVVGARFGDNYARTFSGTLDVTDSLLLFNHRDVWARAWDNWQLHLSQMNIQNNLLSVEDENFPNNTLWDPQADPAQLDALAVFLPTPATTVGIGLAVNENTRDIARLNPENKIPVRLSTFTTHPVSVDYAVTADGTELAAGILTFTPGQTVQFIEFAFISAENPGRVSVTLANPAGAELTGISRLTFEMPYEIRRTLVAAGDSWQYFKGTAEPPADWNQPVFDDSAWLSGPSGFGYEASSGYQACIATNLTDMRGSYYSVYARRSFSIDDPARLTELKLTMEYDDGYIAYLNGVPVDSRYPPSPVAHNRPASSDSHEACCGSGCAPRTVDLMPFAGLLTPGLNVLAVQAHNGTLGSSDFIFIPALTAVFAPIPGDTEPDGDVDLQDLSVFAQAWLTAAPNSGYNPRCDTEPDGDVDLNDLAALARSWLTTP